jgi:cytochrome d ubiquinol oxidase subunit I
VAFGTLVSAFWIISANSWMQHPVAFHIDGQGRMVANAWAPVIFSPSFPTRFAHMVLAAYLSTALVVAGASAFQLLRHKDQKESATALRMAVAMLAIVAPLQLLVGDASGKIVGEVQPAKLAAIEGFWETRSGLPFNIVAWPDRERQANRFAVSIPKAGSLITHGSFDARVQGLTDFPRADQPPAAVVFWAFRIMVGLGVAMIGVGVWGAWLWWRKALTTNRWFLRAAMVMAPAGFVAVVAGWTTAEVGRQPWVVYGVLRTADAVAPVRAGSVSASLIMFLANYALVFAAGALFILRLIAEGPVKGSQAPTGDGRAPGTPLAAAPGQGDT